MFKRKLRSLGHHDHDTFDSNDELSCRRLIAWLEDQVIRHYPIEDRAPLRDINSSQWLICLEQYLADLNCPYRGWTESSTLVLDWLLCLALRLEFEDNSAKYSQRAIEKSGIEKSGTQNGNGTGPQFVHANSLDALNFESDEFKHGTAELAAYLNVPLHPNHLITLLGCCKVIENKYAPAAAREHRLGSKQAKLSKVAPMNLNELRLGFSTGDKVLDRAMKVMRLLYINDLKELQTAINTTIVKVQSVTANPKTDTSLGKIGRG